MTEASPTVHASCIVAGTVGLLVRGKPGSGKSSLCDILVETARARGHFASWVSDDRTVLFAEKDRLLARPTAGLEGRFEVRGLGILSVSVHSVAGIDLVADLVSAGDLERMPEAPVTRQTIDTVHVPSCRLLQNSPAEAIRRLRWILRQLFPNRPDYF